MDRKKVIWSIEDARESHLVGMSRANYSRPPMQKSIRHPDGTALALSEYRTILALGKEVIREILLPLPEPRNWDRTRKTKTYYMSNHAGEFTKAVRALEQKEILLSYCAGSWKAEHVLMGLLQGDEAPAESQSQGPEISVGLDKTQPRAKSKRKRSATDGSRPSKRQDSRESNEGEKPSRAVHILPSYLR
jgi:hypothetical protein